MTGAEEDVTVDATDIKVLRSMVNVLAGLASIQSAYNWDYNAGDLLDLDMEVVETSLQEVREKHPNLFGVQSVSQLQNAKAFIQSAIDIYQTASICTSCIWPLLQPKAMTWISFLYWTKMILKMKQILRQIF